MVKFNEVTNNLTVDVDDRVIEELERCAVKSYPNETGGFLVGKYESAFHACLSRLLRPAEEKQSRHSYERSTRGMAETWNRLYEQGLIYLGEWHTHPDGSCQYSQMDFDAMKEIAESKEVKIVRPLLLIASASDIRIENINLYHYYDGRLLQFY